MFTPSKWSYLVRDTALSLAAGTWLERDPESSDQASTWLLADNCGNFWRLSPDKLLALSDLYLRQPEEDFWVVGRLNFRPSQGMWLSDPVRLLFGPDPFRFESEGELRFFMRQASATFNTNRCWIGQLHKEHLNGK